MPEDAHEVHRLMAAIVRSIPLWNLELPDEFYPAHLSVALMDSVFHSRGRHDDAVVSAAEQYCNRFKVSRTRADRWEPPAAEEQETLVALIRRYDELGADWMADEVFRRASPFTEAAAAHSVSVLRAARALRRIGINVLQDVPTRSCDRIEHELRSSVGLGETTIRILLMYTGNDDFVRGDGCIRKFVADAMGRKRISGAGAECLVRWSAYELVLSPRYLDYRIWKLRSMRTAGRDEREPSARKSCRSHAHRRR